eukprot:TRINITY_DN1306_c1_g3_i1.p1 TRINITY_DN1306_c1_g3~~TRINITY_DN1306_c1_g3_i1.p1  ORF type:complete len:422 (+),score=115.16 TRINITY_DN1306_c1_g3_i1:68-1333(+)
MAFVVGVFVNKVTSFLVAFAVWVLWSSYMWWNMLLCEDVAMDLANDPDSGSEGATIRLYTLLGGFAWMILLGGATFLIMAVAECISGTEDSIAMVGFSATWYAFVTYWLLFSISFQDPYGKLRRYKMNMKALDYGGLEIRGCYQPNATHLAVAERDVWVYLSDEGWTVNNSAAIFKPHPEDASWKYIIAPIVYNGTVWQRNDTNASQCGFWPPVYTWCIKKTNGNVTKKDCNWELPRPLPYRLTIRKTRWGEFLDTTERGYFPTPPGVRGVEWRGDKYEENHRIFDFDAYSMGETQRFVGDVETDQYEYRRRMMFIWMGISLPVGLLLLAIWLFDGESCFQRRERVEREASSQYADRESAGDRSQEMSARDPNPDPGPDVRFGVAADVPPATAPPLPMAEESSDLGELRNSTRSCEITEVH